MWQRSYTTPQWTQEPSVTVSKYYYELKKSYDESKIIPEIFKTWITCKQLDNIKEKSIPLIYLVTHDNVFELCPL